MRIEIENTIDVDNESMAKAFSDGDAFEQAEFLDEIAVKCQSYNWCMQALMIEREIQNKEEVRCFLRTLLAHIEEPDKIKGLK